MSSNFPTLQQFEDSQQTFLRLQTFLKEGGKPQEIVSYIADLTDVTDSDETEEAMINSISSYFLTAMKCTPEDTSKKINKLFQAYLEVSKKYHHQLLFYDALKSRQFAVAEKLYESQFDVNEADSATGVTALHLLVQDGNEEAVTWLFQHQAVADKPLSDGRTALHIASSLKYRKIAQILINHGANVNARSIERRFTPLHYAASIADNSDLLELLIERGADVQAETADKLTALAFASMSEANVRILNKEAQKKRTFNS